MAFSEYMNFIRNYLAQSLFTINLILAVIFVKIGTLQTIMALIVEYQYWVLKYTKLGFFSENHNQVN